MWIFSTGDADGAVDLYKSALRIIKESNYMDIDNTVLENMRIDLAELLHFVGRYSFCFSNLLPVIEKLHSFG